MATVINNEVAVLTSVCIDLATKYTNKASLPPYFAMHMNGGSSACRDKYKQLAIQIMACSLEYNESVKNKEGSYEEEIKGIAQKEIKKIMMIKKD
jgi:hypothetical protein